MEGLGNYSGHTTLYSLAKKQDPDWARKLPNNLRFGALGAAAGYTEFDPIHNFDEYINTMEPKMQPNDIEVEPIPDAQQVKRRGRP